MEHRYATRFPVQVEVRLYKNRNPMTTAQTRNIALGGMFVETAPRGFRKNSLLEVEITSTLDPEKTNHHRIPALVVHHSDDGLGLAFDTADPETIAAVKELLESIAG